ncbi:MAG TPA: 2-oxoacid:acceptor oxidoreductase family protein [Acidobacteriota bacterium]|nr:2-oxoacid:acceptor oxidoreductase family protein [Acidobacteriota bacterium]
MSAGVFYDQFNRHAHGEGLKGRSTHYCPGCGHGLIHKYLAESIDELGIQDRTIAISPVGCAVFLYYYLDVGNTQAAHGRAPVVGIGHKLANPNSIVIGYQGDGDLASIGLAEIIQVAQMGIPFTVIFVNNAVYGMTGGQMAPTTLMGMRTTTSPSGRNSLMGEPLKVAEMMAQLDGTVYVERVALYDNKQRHRAKKAVKKAIQVQIENRGVGFVEVLSECPIHWHMTPQEAETWLKEKMVPAFPLGVKKDVPKESWFELQPPTFDPQKMVEVIRAEGEPILKFSKGFPEHIADRDIAIKFAGAGGDGAQTAAMLVTRAAINENFDSTHIPSYGPESRGGTSYADVHIAEEEVLSPAAPMPHILIAFNAPSLAKFGSAVQDGGVILYDSSVIRDAQEPGRGIHQYGIPFTEIAMNLGRPVVKNIVALGALCAATHLFPEEAFLTAIRQALRDKCAMIPLNEEAFVWGSRAFKEEFGTLNALARLQE